MSFNTSVNRRQFVAGAAAAAAMGSIAGIASASATEATGTAPFETTVDWDAEYDVVVVGLGGAGCATAITAADLGSKVLVLEKACEGHSGGNSNVCMQFMGWTDDVPRMIDYMKWMRGTFETPSDEMIQVYIEEMAQNKEWFEYLGASDTTSFSMPEFPMCEYVDAFKPFTTNGYYGVRPGENFGGDGQTYALLKRNVVERADLIDVWYEAAAEHLIQDPQTKIVHGVEAQVNGQPVKVRAKNGVVLTCGGFENNVRMQQDYFGNTFWPSLGRALWNEGDGIRMAQEIGAQLWHMNNRATTNGEFYDSETQDPHDGLHEVRRQLWHHRGRRRHPHRRVPRALPHGQPRPGPRQGVEPRHVHQPRAARQHVVRLRPGHSRQGPDPRLVVGRRQRRDGEGLRSKRPTPSMSSPSSSVSTGRPPSAS